MLRISPLFEVAETHTNVTTKSCCEVTFSPRKKTKEERLCTRCQLAEGAAAKPSEGCSDSREFEAGRSAKCLSTTTVACGRSKVPFKFDAAFSRISMLRMWTGECKP